ncbi:septation protein A [Antarcticirhabdus aurantiaca]|uniref:Septation protein A n=1 Tax=Antarcticirhabdus aurantiaca TaxID=2606717 RepID=A0ACD4NS35_9HYPH|nr:septation protein A [Antarcticirhabdus aurantiaca]WAJ29614.1 septation protein A [Jeongeuplla avenae]
MSDRIIEDKPNAPGKPEMNPLLKLVLELGPILVFFFANLRGEQLIASFPALGVFGGPLLLANTLFMLATALSLAVSWSIMRTLPLMPLVSCGVVVVFGVAAIWLQDEVFVKMKPTIINGLFAAVLLGGLAFGKPLLGYVFDQAFKLDMEGWKKLSFRWGLFFVFLAILNEAVWRGADAHFALDTKAGDDFWVNFKLWGTMPITFIFTLFQFPLIKRHSLEPIGGPAEPPKA